MARRRAFSAGRFAGRFLADDRGISLIEFSILLPILLAVMLGGIQLVNYVDATRRVELVAASISQMISQANPPAGSTIATLNKDDLHFAYDATLVLFPYLLTDSTRKQVLWWQNININFAGIKFTQVSTGCASSDQSACYTAAVSWTSTGTSGGQYRPCAIPQLPASNAANPTRTTLPRSVFGPGSLIAVDVAFTFTPTFGAKFIPELTIARSIFVQPRFASVINYDTTNNDGIATLCP